jgi:Uma2 family endonuclease
MPEVWIVDLAGAAVEVYRQPNDGAYVSPSGGPAVRSRRILYRGVAIDLAALLA